MNRIYRITSVKAEKIAAEAASKKIFVAELYGKKIKTCDDYLDAISKEFRYSGSTYPTDLQRRRYL